MPNLTLRNLSNVDSNGGQHWWRVALNCKYFASSKTTRQLLGAILAIFILCISVCSSIAQASTTAADAFAGHALHDICYNGESVFVLSSVRKTPESYFVDPDGTKAYKSDLYLSKIGPSGSLTKILLGDVAPNGEQPSGTGALYDSGTSIQVFINSKESNNTYGMTGRRYTVEVLLPTMAVTSSAVLFSNANWGWWPVIRDSSGTLSHFSFSGYYRYQNTTNWGSVDPAVMLLEYQSTVAMHSSGIIREDEVNTINGASRTAIISRLQLVLDTTMMHFVDAIRAPGDGTEWTYGTTKEITWDTSLLQGNTVTLMIMPLSPDSNQSGIERVFTDSRPIVTAISSENLSVLAGNVPNTGQYSVNTAALGTVGNSYKIVILSNTSYWSVSKGWFTLLASSLSSTAPEVYVNTNKNLVYQGEELEVNLNTSVDSTNTDMSAKYNVYLSIEWGDTVLYDSGNGNGFVSNRAPLLSNISVPVLDDWYTHLRYNFDPNFAQTDFVLTIQLEDQNGNSVFSNSASVTYIPEANPFVASVSYSPTKAALRAASVTAVRFSLTSASNYNCNLGGIRTSVNNGAATALNTATKHSLMALQMGSAFDLGGGRLRSLYTGVKGAYNLFKKGEDVCKQMQHIESIANNYDDNISYYGLSQDQATDIFAIELLTTALSMYPGGGGTLYGGFNSKNLVNGVRSVFDLANKRALALAAIDNYAYITIELNQPRVWGIFWHNTDPVDLTVTVRPVFTYDDGYEDKTLGNTPRTFTTASNIETSSIDVGILKSYTKSMLFSDNKKSIDLKRGLYLIKAARKDASGNEIEVYRDTVHVVSNGQKCKMLIQR